MIIWLMLALSRLGLTQGQHRLRGRGFYAGSGLLDNEILELKLRLIYLVSADCYLWFIKSADGSSKEEKRGTEEAKLEIKRCSEGVD